MNALKVVCGAFSGVNAEVLNTADVQSTMEYGAVTFGLMTQNIIDKRQVIQNQGMRCIFGALRRTSAAVMRKELQFLPVFHIELSFLRIQSIRYTLKSTPDAEDSAYIGLQRCKTVTCSYQIKWMTTHFYKQMTALHGRFCLTSAG